MESENMNQEIIIERLVLKDTEESNALMVSVDYYEGDTGVNIAGFFKHGYWDDCLHVHSSDYLCPFCHKKYANGWLTCKANIKNKLSLLEDLLKQIPYEQHENIMQTSNSKHKEPYLAYIKQLQSNSKVALTNLSHWFWDKTTDEFYLTINIDFSFITVKEDIPFKHTYTIPVRYYFFENRFEIEPILWIQFFTESIEYEATEQEKKEILDYVQALFTTENPLSLGQKVYFPTELDYEVWEGTVKETKAGIPYIEYTNGEYAFLFKKDDVFFSKEEAQTKLFNYIKPEYEELSQGNTWITYLFDQWVHYNAGKDERFSNKRQALVELIKERTGVNVEEKNE